MSTTNQTALIARLLAICERFGTPPDQHGNRHLDHREGIDFRGVCVGHRTYTGGERVRDGSGWRMANQTLSGQCAPSCQEYQSVVAAAREHVAAHAVRQLSLEVA